MADKKITALTDLGTAVIGTDILHIIDDPAGTPVNKKISIDSLMNNMPSWLAFDSTAQALTASTGTVNATTAVTTLATAAVSAYGMDNGVTGQIKVITMITDGGTATITPTTLNGYATMAFAKGFLMVSSTPLTRSSYHASEDFIKLKKAREEMFKIN